MKGSGLVAGIAAGFFAGAGYRGYRLGKEHTHLDDGWNGGWQAVTVINLLCFVLSAALMMEALVRPVDD